MGRTADGGMCEFLVFEFRELGTDLVRSRALVAVSAIREELRECRTFTEARIILEGTPLQRLHTLLRSQPYKNQLFTDETSTREGDLRVASPEKGLSVN